MSSLVILTTIIVLSVATSWSLSVAARPSPSASPSSASSVLNDYDEPPRIVKQTKPVYPKKPFWAGVQGTVLIEFVVDAMGRVKDPKVTESVPGLDDAALECVKQWHFSPARKGGAPVASVAQAPVTFRITERKKK